MRHGLAPLTTMFDGDLAEGFSKLLAKALSLQMLENDR